MGLARGGVVVSSTIARKLALPHDALVVKKIGSPGNPELAIGARVPKNQEIDVAGKTVILTDDGIATGETMKAAIAWIRNHGAKKIVVAAPIAPESVVPSLRAMADEVSMLETPKDFGAVGQYYREFPQVTDEEVIELLDT